VILVALSFCYTYAKGMENLCNNLTIIGLMLFTKNLIEPAFDDDLSILLIAMAALLIWNTCRGIKDLIGSLRP